MVRLLSWLLFPITMWYAIVVKVRNLLYDLGVLHQHTHPVVTIGIGNLSTGGTGKTPMAEYIIDFLKDKYETALLSRGYGRNSRGFVMHEGDTPFVENLSQTMGDEVAMITRRHPEITTAVCRNRHEGVNRLLSQEQPPRVIVLDDCFQHRTVKPTVNILLTPYRHPFYADHILPFGNLREPSSGYLRANIIVVTKSPRKVNALERHLIYTSLKAQSYQKVFFSYIDYGKPVSFADGRVCALDDVRYVLCLTAIADSAPLLAELRCHGRKVDHLAFPDHHRFTRSDIVQLRQRFDAINSESKAIVTTEKDIERLRTYTEELADLPIYYLPISVGFYEDGGNSFSGTLLSLVKENISYLDRLKTAGMC